MTQNLSDWMGEVPTGYEERQRRPTLYRYFDADGRLLYVGVTVGHLSRMMAHSLAAVWWTEAAYCTLEHHDTELMMYAAERVAIETEKPIYNRAFSTTWNSPEEKERRRKAREVWKRKEDARLYSLNAHAHLQAGWRRLMALAASGVPIE